MEALRTLLEEDTEAGLAQAAAYVAGLGEANPGLSDLPAYQGALADLQSTEMAVGLLRSALRVSTQLGYVAAEVEAAGPGSLPPPSCPCSRPTWANWPRPTRRWRGAPASATPPATLGGHGALRGRTPQLIGRLAHRSRVAGRRVRRPARRLPDQHSGVLVGPGRRPAADARRADGPSPGGAGGAGRRVRDPARLLPAGGAGRRGRGRRGGPGDGFLRVGRRHRGPVPGDPGSGPLRQRRHRADPRDAAEPGRAGAALRGGRSPSQRRDRRRPTPTSGRPSARTSGGWPPSPSPGSCWCSSSCCGRWSPRCTWWPRCCSPGCPAWGSPPCCSRTCWATPG